MFRSGGWDGIIKSPYFMVPPESLPCLRRLASLAPGLKLRRLPSDGADDLIHTGHPRHAREHEVHTGVMIQISAAPFTALPGRLFDGPVYSWGKPHNLFSSSLYPNHLYPLY